MSYLYRILGLLYGVLFAIGIVPMTSLCVFILVFLACNAAAEAGRDFAIAATRRPWWSK